MLTIDTNKILLLQTKKCLTNVQLSKDAKISRQTLANVVSGRHKGSMVTIGKLANALEVEVNDILKREF